MKYLHKTKKVAKCLSVNIVDYKIECLVSIFRVYAKPEDCSNFAVDEVKKMCTNVVYYQMALKQNKHEVCDKIEDSQLKIYCVRILTGKSPDTDNDGLNDYDEVFKYQTDLANPDTDADGYKDGAEVKNGYNPNGPGELTPEK